MRAAPRHVLCSTRVHAGVLVVNTREAQQTGLLAYHGGGEDRVGGHSVPLQTPGEGQRLVASRHCAHQLGRVTLVYWELPERERYDSGGFWNRIFLVPSSDLPLTFSSAEYVDIPAIFSALQV